MRQQVPVETHATASAHLFGWVDGEWQVGLVDHPRLKVWMPPGGHVDPGETPDVTVMRECAEETGIHPQLLHLVARPVDEPLPTWQADAMSRPLPLPWWMTDETVGPDSRSRSIHRHVDHHFLVVSEFVRVIPGMGETAFGWFSRDEVNVLPSCRIPDDFRAIALAAFPLLWRLHQAGLPAVAFSAVRAGEQQ